VSKKVLGKGISALIPDDDFQKPEERYDRVEKGIQNIDLMFLRTNPDQPRKSFNPESLKELAESIKSKGIIQPVIAEKRSDEEYIIIAGERRFRAAQIAECKNIPVIVRKFSAEEKLEIALIENIQREDLNPIEEAEAYQNLITKIGLNQDDLAKRVGKNRSTVANSIRLLKLPKDIQLAIIDGELSPGHARALLSLVNPADQSVLFKEIVEKGLSVRLAEKKAGEFNAGQRLKGKKDRQKSVEKPIEIREIEDRFIDSLGTKVTLKGSIKKGKIVIDYFSQEDLERIFNIISET